GGVARGTVEQRGRQHGQSQSGGGVPAGIDCIRVSLVLRNANRVGRVVGIDQRLTKLGRWVLRFWGSGIESGSLSLQPGSTLERPVSKFTVGPPSATPSATGSHGFV